MLIPDGKNTEQTKIFLFFCSITWKILKQTHIHSRNPTVFLKHQRRCGKNINKQKTKQKTPNNQEKATTEELKG